MVFLLSVMIVFAFAGLVLFHGGVLQGIVMLVLAVGMLVWHLVLRKKVKLPAIVAAGIYIVCILGYLACGLFQSNDTSGVFVSDHQQQANTIEKLITAGETDEAREKLEKFTKDFGESDETVLMEAAIRLKSGENGSAVLSFLKRNIQNKGTLGYYLGIAECYHAGTGFDYDYRLLEKETLVEGAQKYPDDFLLNFRAGCLCAEKEKYGSAEYYLVQAFNLSGKDDPFTPYVLATVYGELGDEAYEYAFMTIAVQRGADELEGYGEDPIFDRYRENLALVKADTEKNGASSSSSEAIASYLRDTPVNSYRNTAERSGYYNNGNLPSKPSIPEVKITWKDIEKAWNDFIGVKNRLQTGDTSPEGNIAFGATTGGGVVNRADSVVTSVDNLYRGNDKYYNGETMQAGYRALQAENIVYNVFSPSSKTPGADVAIGYAHDKAIQAADDPETIKKINQFRETHRDIFDKSDRELRKISAHELRRQGYSDKEVNVYIYQGWDEFVKYIETKQDLENYQEKNYRYWKKMAAYARIHGFNPVPAKGITIEKPNIYLYPIEDTEITVTFAESDRVTVSEPEYSDGWTVKAQPDGTLTNLADGNSHGFLYYEAELYGDYYQYSEGFAIPKEGRDAVFREILTQYGLNETEIRDFTEYWTERLDPDKDYVAYPQFNDTVDAVMPIEITPEPDSILRLWFIFKEDVAQEYTAPEITTFEREGYSVVEWGGAVR